MTVEIKTNGQERELMEYLALRPSEQKEFDYIREEERFDIRFFRYKGEVYDLYDIPAITLDMVQHIPELDEWVGFIGESYFSGILVGFPNDPMSNGIIVGQLFS